MLSIRRLSAVFAAAVLSLGAASAADDGPLTDYATKVRPLLAARCFSCHGGLEQKSGLRLDTVALMTQGGESGAAVVKGDPGKSLILARVSDTDPATRMPPEGEGEALSAEEVALLRDWIAAGCPAPADEKPEADPRDHWAFQPRVRPAVPPLDAAAGLKNPIDAFLAAARGRAGVTPQPEAPRHVLVRRLFIDLIGLPPQPEDIAAIEADTDPDWYERLVDRLLADPRYGERWARHWMDVWRYSDWWGLGEQHRNSQKHMWHFRDWIVESLNADTGYDEMVRQMLAADELHPDDPAKLRATGFLARNWFLFNRTPWMDETVEHVGKGLLGLTLNCAKCHAHKYDPVSQEDYYRFRAFFDPLEARVDVVPGEADLEKDGIPRVFDGHPDRPTHLLVRGEDTRPDTSRSFAPGVPAILAGEGSPRGDLAIEAVPLPKAASEPERQPWVLDAHVAAARRTLESAEAALAKAAEKEAAARTLLAAAEREATARTPSVAAAASASAASPDAARAAVVAAERESAAAAAKLAVARAAVESVVRRAEATRIGWETEAASPDSADRRAEAARAAARGERGLVLAQSRQKVVEIEARLAAAAADKKPAIEKELVAARDAVAKAEKGVDDPGSAFTLLVGAKWVPTRFKGSGSDDPAVPFPATSTGRRTALARWITDPRNPLAPRVAVNHIWMRHFGRPLVPTVFEFGRKGVPPVHPELLDWLASEFVEGPAGSGTGRGFGMKHLHRLICTSAAYRMHSSTAGNDAARAADPDNRLLWRREPIRLEAQVVRDGILALAGTLDPTMGGAPVPAADQMASRRRSLYFWHSDISRNLFLTTFDDAAVKECYQRDQSIVPQQALALANAGLVHDAAARINGRLDAAGPPADQAAFVARAFATVLGRPPSADEAAACAAALAQGRGNAAPAAGAPDPARVLVVWALLNHNDFLTLR